MPELDDWGYNEWADAAQRGLSAEASQRRYEQGQKRPPAHEFVELDKKELRQSEIRGRDAWNAYRADISRQVEQCYAARRLTETNTPDADEVEALEYWNRNSRTMVIAYQVGLRELLAMNHARELFESGEGTLVQPRKIK